MTNDQPGELEQIEKKYGHLLVVASSLLLVVAVIIGSFISHWFAARLHSDFWPIDKATVVVTVMAVFYPPLRRAIDAAAARHKNEIKAHITNELGEVHRKMDHIIYHHPDIPPLPTKEDTP